MNIREKDYMVDYEPETGDASVYKDRKLLMHICMDTFLAESEVIRAFRELLVGINAVQ